MAGDDCSLHFQLDTLTPKQQADHRANQVLTGMLQVAALYMAKPTDHVCLYQEFNQAPWSNALSRYLDMFKRMGLCADGTANISYHAVDEYYTSVAATPSDATLENLYMVSGSNNLLHDNAEHLQISQHLNSKIHFAQHAECFGLPVPQTLVTSKADMTRGEDAVIAFMQRHGPTVMLKTLGLAGARNVTAISSLQEGVEYLAEYASAMPVILQQKLNMNDYIEMTVDLNVSADSISISNVRQILFADGLWVGNLLGAAVSLSSAEEATLLQVGEYARQHGYTSHLAPAEHFNLGVDYFVRSAEADPTLPPLLVTEINARWTGGLFPAQLVRRLGCDELPVVAFIDMCPPDRFEQYLEFVEANLYSTTTDSLWSIAPMGFSPLPDSIEETSYLYVWQIVIGDFAAFKIAKQASLGDQILPTVPLISTGL